MIQRKKTNSRLPTTTLSSSLSRSPSPHPLRWILYVGGFLLVCGFTLYNNLEMNSSTISDMNKLLLSSAASTTAQQERLNVLTKENVELQQAMKALQSKHDALQTKYDTKSCDKSMRDTRSVAAVKQQPTLTVEQCRGVFKASGQGGNGEMSLEKARGTCNTTPFMYDACEDLQAFTGLADDEFWPRMARKGRYHFEAEHDFWNPQSKTELAWYYSTSVNYLFANVVHGVWKKYVNRLASAEFEPVLDYSGGVGNNILFLAEKGLRSRYFGIGRMEYDFARYRVKKRDLGHLVEFVTPYTNKTGYVFDPINGALPRDGTLGGIIAMDVLEHIPNYHVVVEAMVDSLRVGGGLVEQTPFAADQQQATEEDQQDLRVHLGNGGVTMEQAMGPRMEQKAKGFWIKISN